MAVTSPVGILILIDETMKPPALRLAAIKESSSNLMKCYEESENKIQTVTVPFLNLWFVHA